MIVARLKRNPMGQIPFFIHLQFLHLPINTGNDPVIIHSISHGIQPAIYQNGDIVNKGHVRMLGENKPSVAGIACGECIMIDYSMLALPWGRLWRGVINITSG